MGERKRKKWLEIFWEKIKCRVGVFWLLFDLRLGRGFYMGSRE